MQALDIIGGFPGFHRLEEAVLNRLAAISRIVEVTREAVLCQQGGLPDVLHYLLDGQVALTQTAANGSSAMIDVVEPVRSLVLADVVAGQPHAMTARAIKACRVLEIPAAPLREMIAVRPRLAVAMLEGLAWEVDATTRHILDLKLRSSAQRLGCYLLALAKRPECGGAEFRLPLQKRLLADRIGCRFEHLSRAFAVLRDYGVETRGSRVILHDIIRLRDFSVPDDTTLPLDAAPLSRAAKVLGDAFRF